MTKKILLLVMLSYTVHVQAQLVALSGGKLKYNTYANEGQTNKVNIIPDFSIAGYGRGGVALPFLKTVITVNPTQGDCTKLIQQALDEVSSMPVDKEGYRGAVLLKKGVYQVYDTLIIRAGGVVLRGEGNMLNGTVLIARKKMKHNFITIQGTGKGYGEVKNSKRRIISAYIPTGSRDFEIENGHGFATGDHIVIQKTPGDHWIQELSMAQYGWKADDYKVAYERIITHIDGTKITVDIPFMDPVDSNYGGAEVFKSAIQGRLSQSGVEDIRIESSYDSDEDEKHGWNAIVMVRTENCWVKNVVAKYFGYACVSISEMSVFNTVQDCAMIDPKSITTGGRKYSFNIEFNSTSNLFQRCVTWGGRHDYVTGARVPGPNVFLDCAALNTFADVGPHHRWSTGLLFDNIYGGEIRVQNRKAMGSGHGWAGAQTLFWNCTSVTKEIKVESPLGAMNWGIGCIGLKKNGDGYWESWGTHVSPRSLYLKQLEERAGPEAVNKITTPDQRNGMMADKLKVWAEQLVAEGKVVY